MRKKASNIKKIMLAGALALVGFFIVFLNATSTAFAADFIIQDEPFIIQTTAGNNNNLINNLEDQAEILEKRGNSVVVNQRFNPSSFRSGTEVVEGLTFTKSEKTLTISGTNTETNNTSLVANDTAFTDGHKYLIYYNAKNVPSGVTLTRNYSDFSNWSIRTGSSSEDHFRPTINITETGIVFNDMTVEYYVFDLTQWFGSNDNIPAQLLSNPEDFFKYYQGPLDYNSGTLINANGRYLQSIGRNIYDPTKPYNKVISNTNYYYFGEESTTITFYDSENNIISNQIVAANSIFTCPINCVFINSSYISNITISIYSENEIGYNQYYSYEILSVIDTGEEVLRSIGLIYDYKLPNGDIVRSIGEREYEEGDEIDESVITDGDITYYLLDEQIIEEGTSFENIININNLGFILWDNEEFNGISQGNKIIYQLQETRQSAENNFNLGLVVILIIIILIAIFTGIESRRR